MTNGQTNIHTHTHPQSEVGVLLAEAINIYIYIYNVSIGPRHVPMLLGIAVHTVSMKFSSIFDIKERAEQGC